LANLKRFRICIGIYTDSEKVEHKCKVSRYCKRFVDNYTFKEAYELQGYKRPPKELMLFKPSHKPNDTGGCPSFVPNSDRYMKRYERHLRHK